MRQHPALCSAPLVAALLVGCSGDPIAPHTTGALATIAAPNVVVAAEALTNRIVLSSQPAGSFSDIVTMSFA